VFITAVTVTVPIIKMNAKELQVDSETRTQAGKILASLNLASLSHSDQRTASERRSDFFFVFRFSFFVRCEQTKNSGTESSFFVHKFVKL
jgi:hypothetical protein